MATNLPTDLLRTFVTVARVGSVTVAGDLLGRSQPALSLQIKRLEGMLDVELFHRGGRKLVLSERGKVLFAYAEQILSNNDEAVTRLTRPSLTGHVHLGIPNEFAASFLPAVLRRYAQGHPEVTVQVTCDLSVNLVARLQAGEFDLVLALQDRSVDLPSACQWAEPAVWVGTTGSQAQKTRPLPLILAPQGCVYRARILATLETRNIPWRVAYTSPNFSGIRAGVAAGLGVTAMAQSTVTDGLKRLGPLDQLPALPDVSMQLLHADKRQSRAAKRLIEHIAQQALPGQLSPSATD